VQEVEKVRLELANGKMTFLTASVQGLLFLIGPPYAVRGRVLIECVTLSSLVKCLVESTDSDLKFE
jgi:hypothetical protein